MKLQAFGVETALGEHGALFPVAQTGPLQAAMHRQVQQQGQVRHEAAGRHVIDAEQMFRVQAAAIALVSQGGIRVAVAEHGLPGFQGPGG